MKTELVILLTALRFLTIIPLRAFNKEDGNHFVASVRYFPVIGLLIGGAGFFLCKALASFLPPAVVILLVIFYLASISGFLHLDGLADTADGFFSARPKEKILAIMHDSRIGAMGVILLFFILAFKVAALVSIPFENLPVAVFFMPFAGRCAIVLTMLFIPYARREGGLGRHFYGEGNKVIPLLTVLLLFIGGCFGDFTITVGVFITMIVMIFFFGLWCKKKIGGTTGDTLGAVCEITETGVAIVLAGLFMHMQG